MASSGAYSVITDRPTSAGGRGLGFSGGQLLYAAIAGCSSNDLYREAATMGITLNAVEVLVDGDFPARGSASTAITVDLDVRGDAPEAQLRALADEVIRIAEIPRTIREASPIEYRVNVVATPRD